MKFRLLDTQNQRDRHCFIQLPFDIYIGNSNWVPPLESEMNLLMDRVRHPFYQHSTADFFIAESEGSILGRIAILENRNFNEYHNSRRAFFYYFDVIDDFQVAQGLFDIAIDWSKKKRLNQLFGPKGFSRSAASGMLIEGFDHRAALGVPYNHAYYITMMEKIGFEKETDYLSGYMDATTHFEERVYAIAERVRVRGKFWIKSFKNKKEMRKIIPEVNRVHNEAFQNIPEFLYYPSTPAEFNLMAESLIQVSTPGLMRLIMSEDEVAGFMIAYPDLAEGVQKIKGRLWPFGWITLLAEKRKTKTVSLNGLGLIPRFQGLGSNALLYVEVEKTLRQTNYEKVETIQVDEKNFRSKNDMEAMTTHWVKRHRVFKKNID